MEHGQIVTNRALENKSIALLEGEQISLDWVNPTQLFWQSPFVSRGEPCALADILLSVQFLSRPFVVGDRVELLTSGGSKFMVGYVERVDPMRTIFRTDACLPVMIPNKVTSGSFWAMGDCLGCKIIRHRHCSSCDDAECCSRILHQAIWTAHIAVLELCSKQSHSSCLLCVHGIAKGVLQLPQLCL